MIHFPPAECADEFGLVAVGGDLRPINLIQAYAAGIFPWYEEGWPVHWWSPDPRAIFELDGLHVSRRLARTVRSGKFQVTFDRDFSGVMMGCAERAEGTWITAEMLQAYQELHRLGLGHSVETWYQGQLAGGVYGVALRGLFAAESMFYRVSDASKVALTCLVQHLTSRGFTLLDVQMLTEHTARLGAIEIPRHVYLQRLQGALERRAAFRDP